MAEMIIDEMNGLDRNSLMKKLLAELPEIGEEAGLSSGEIGWRAGMPGDRMHQLAEGRRTMRWSEYMSILFVLWSDDKGRVVLDRKGLFPVALRNAMSVNRNDHVDRSDNVVKYKTHHNNSFQNKI
ncbi:MAG: hypothetical protein IJT96_09295 [Lachnospiraceae bacterium]|nr:hypothetical protein [Lachnospiraceae bacterium]